LSTDSTNQNSTRTKSEDATGDKSILVAYATIHLLTGESFQLLPFQHEGDVKTEVSKLIESWSKSGFLLRGRWLYPWHQVRLVEVTSVEELSASQAAQSLVDWEIRDEYRVLDGFWKTKKPQSKPADETKGEAQAGAAPGEPK